METLNSIFKLQKKADSFATSVVRVRVNGEEWFCERFFHDDLFEEEIKQLFGEAVYSSIKTDDATVEVEIVSNRTIDASMFDKPYKLDEYRLSSLGFYNSKNV